MSYRIREEGARKVTLTVNLPLSIAGVVDKIAYSEGVSLSSLLVRVIRKGLEVEREERKRKLGATGTKPELEGSHDVGTVEAVR